MSFTLGRSQLSKPSLRHRSHLPGIQSSSFWIRVGRGRGSGLRIRRRYWWIVLLISWPSITPSLCLHLSESSQDSPGRRWIDRHRAQRLPQRVRAAAAVGPGPRGHRQHYAQEQPMLGIGDRLQWWHRWSRWVEGGYQLQARQCWRLANRWADIWWQDLHLSPMYPRQISQIFSQPSPAWNPPRQIVCAHQLLLESVWRLCS